MRNDERILDAALELLAEQGWNGFSVQGVAVRSGLSRRPVLDRFPDREALAASVWGHRVSAALVDALSATAAAADVATLRGTSAALEPFLRPEPALAAAAELLVVRQYEPRVRTALDRSLAQWFTTTLGTGPRPEAARRAYLVMLALGLLLAWPGPRSDVPGIDPILREVCAALAARRAPSRQPSRNARHLDDPHPIDTGDPAVDHLLRATLDQLGREGFDRATTARIARAAGVSEGFLFARYRTKLELVDDATRRSAAVAAARNEQFMARLEREHSAGMAEAVFLREIMRPGRELQRSTNLEQRRLVRHHPVLQAYVDQEFRALADAVRGTSRRWDEAAFRARYHVAVSVGFGAILLAQLHPESWRLPYDVVTDAVAP